MSDALEDYRFVKGADPRLKHDKEREGSVRTVHIDRSGRHLWHRLIALKIVPFSYSVHVDNPHPFASG